MENRIWISYKIIVKRGIIWFVYYNFRKDSEKIDLLLRSNKLMLITKRHLEYQYDLKTISNISFSRKSNNFILTS